MRRGWLGLLFVAAGCSSSPTEVVLYDGEGSRQARIINDVPPSEEDLVLSELFPKRHTNGNQCTPRDGDLAEARATGNVFPRVAYKARGAFTAPNKLQALYVVSVLECGALQFEGWGTTMLAVYERGHLVLRVDDLEGTVMLRAVAPLEPNGRDDVLLTTGFTGGGTSVESAVLVRLDANAKRPILLRDFGKVLDIGCFEDPASREYRPSETRHTLRAVMKRGKPAELFDEPKTTPCHPDS